MGMMDGWVECGTCDESFARCLKCGTIFNAAAYQAYVLEAKAPDGGPTLHDSHVTDGEMCGPVEVIDPCPDCVDGRRNDLGRTQSALPNHRR